MVAPDRRCTTPFDAILSFGANRRNRNSLQETTRSSRERCGMSLQVTHESLPLLQRISCLPCIQRCWIFTPKVPRQDGLTSIMPMLRIGERGTEAEAEVEILLRGRKLELILVHIPGHNAY